MMFRFLILPIFLCLLCTAYSQIDADVAIYTDLHQNERYDTINIDDHYVVLEGHKINVDTGIQSELVGLFYIERLRSLSHHCLIAATQIDTNIIVLDSNVINDTLTYLTDTVYDYKLYYILVEKDIAVSIVSESWVPLHIVHMYNMESDKKLYSNNDSVTLRTVDCDHGYIIIWHKTLEVIHDCSFLHYNLYTIIK